VELYVPASHEGVSLPAAIRRRTFTSGQVLLAPEHDVRRELCGSGLHHAVAEGGEIQALEPCLARPIRTDDSAKCSLSIRLGRSQGLVPATCCARHRFRRARGSANIRDCRQYFETEPRDVGGRLRAPPSPPAGSPLRQGGPQLPGRLSAMAQVLFQVLEGCLSLLIERCRLQDSDARRDGVTRIDLAASAFGTRRFRGCRLRG
jgi:hypothetical protein